MKINNLILVLISILFLGCSNVKPDMEFYSIDIESSNKTAYFKHFNILAPIIKDENEAKKWHFLASNNIYSFNMGLNKHNDKKNVRWLKYSLEIQTYSGENYTFKDSLIFGKTITAGYKEQILVEKEAMEKRNKEYLENRYLNNEYWKKKGIISAKYSNVNKYLAIEITTKTKYMDVDKYLREYKLYSYSKTGKLKYYEIIISVDIDKANTDDPELLVEYSFEDMLKRSQRSLDSFVASDEDFPEDAPKYQ
jgi:hypothetical protein